MISTSVGTKSAKRAGRAGAAQRAVGGSDNIGSLNQSWPQRGKCDPAASDKLADEDIKRGREEILHRAIYIGMRLSHPPRSAWLWSSKGAILRGSWWLVRLCGRLLGAHMQQHLKERRSRRALRHAHLPSVELGHQYRCGAHQLTARLPLVVLRAVALPAHQHLTSNAAASLGQHALDLILRHPVGVLRHGRWLVQALWSTREGC